MKKFRSIRAAAIAIGVFAVIIVFSNIYLKTFRLDLTEQQLFTLSDGSRAIVNGIEEPVRIYFYFSEESSRELTQLRTYADRVDSLLEEYASLSGGRVVVSRIDPEPFSESEDDADRYGLQKVPVGSGGESLYFGLVGSNSLDSTEVITFLQPDKEAFLEYEISQMLYRLSQPAKPQIGLWSTLPVKDRLNPQTFQMEPGWQVIAELERLFEVIEIDAEAEEIDEDIDLLLLIHPKAVSSSMQVAIREHLARGGALIGFIDPLAELDQGGSNPMMPSLPTGQSSDLNWLTEDWGITLRTNEVLGDAQLALSVAGADGMPVRHLAILGLGPEQMNAEAVITTGLESINVASAGILDIYEPKVAVTSLLSSSQFASNLDAGQFQFLRDPNELQAGFTPGAKTIDIGIALSGRLPRSLLLASPRQADSSPDSNSIEADGNSDLVPINVILVSDTDLLSDRLWVQVQNFFGQQIATAWADNGSFLVNAVDYMAGSADLISVRSRGRYTRPFDVVQDLKREAEAKYLQSANQLQLELAETEQRLNDLESQQVAEGRLSLSPEQTAAIDNFQAEKLRIRKQLRDVRHGLDQEIEALGSSLKLINIGLMPLLLTLLLGLLVWARTSKREG